MTLTEYIESNGIERIDLLKIDVELHEPEVIEGFGLYLTKFKPIIFIEVLTNEVANKLNELFLQADYEYFHLLERYKLQKVESLFKAEDLRWNFLLCPHKRTEELEIILNLINDNNES